MTPGLVAGMMEGLSGGGGGTGSKKGFGKLGPPRDRYDSNGLRQLVKA
jgi:hypothetical protein